MLSLKISTAIILLTITQIECSGLYPVHHAPPAAISYVKSIPYNVPPFAASVNVFSRFASSLPRPILHSPPLLTPAVPQFSHFPIAYPQGRSIHPPSVVTREFYPGQVAFPGALPGPLALPGPYAGPLPQPGPLPLSGPLPLPGPLPLSGPLPLPGPLPLSGPGLIPGSISLAGSPYPPGPIPYPAQFPTPESVPHSVIAGPLNPGFPGLPNVNPYAAPFVPPNNVLAPPLLKR